MDGRNNYQDAVPPDYIGDEGDDEYKSEAEVQYEEAEAAEALDDTRRRYLITAEQMSKKRYAEQSFLIGPNLLPRAGKLLITAPTGTGKSAIALYISACLATATSLFGLKHKSKKDDNYGKPFFDVPEKSFVCYLDYEISEALRQKLRLEPLSNSFEDKSFLGNIAFPSHPSNYRLENQLGEGKGNGSFDRLLALATNTKPDVLVIDPFSSTHSLEENSAQVKQALNNIDRIIDAAGTTVILVHHSSAKVSRNQKGEEIDKSAVERPRGHTVIVDWPDTHIHLEDEKQRGRPKVKLLKMEFGKFRHGTKPKSKTIAADFANMTFTEAPDLED
jgi:hypothetical protein